MGRYSASFHNLALSVHALSELVPPPQIVNLFGVPVVRYTEQTIQQAIVLKLARYVSALNACEALLNAGFGQEQGMLQRILDETSEDIDFLALSLIKGVSTERHELFLKGFWAEEFDHPDWRLASQDRPMVKRDKIRSWIANTVGDDPSGATAAAKSVYKTYSGFVHGAASHICDLYDPGTGSFLLNGILGSPLHLDHVSDFTNVVYRGILNCAMAATAFGHEDLIEKSLEHVRQFDAAYGMTGAR